MPVGRPVASQSLGSPVVTAPVPQGPVDATEPRDAGTGDRAIGNGMPEDQRQNVEEDEMPDQRGLQIRRCPRGTGVQRGAGTPSMMTSSRQIKRRRRGRYRRREPP